MEKIIVAICGLLMLFLAYVFFVIIPVTMYAEAECLRNGYPKAKVTIGIEMYCINLDGAATIKVKKL